jgi:hypothetical protein
MKKNGYPHHKMSIKFCLLFVTIVLLLALLGFQCNSEYKRFSNVDGIGHFRFEYPYDYNNVSLRFSPDEFVDAVIKREVVKNGWSDKSIYIFVTSPSFFQKVHSEVHNAATRLEETIADLTDIYEVMQIKNRSQIVIDGIEGEEIVAVYDSRSGHSPNASLPGTPESPSLIIVERHAYFDHNGSIWEIISRSTENVSEKAKADYEHVIETFKTDINVFSAISYGGCQTTSR